MKYPIAICLLFAMLFTGCAMRTSYHRLYAPVSGPPVVIYHAPVSRPYAPRVTVVHVHQHVTVAHVHHGGQWGR